MDLKNPPYVYYPAGYGIPTDAMIGVWIKYVKSGSVKTEVLARGKGWVHIRTPDRELLLDRNINEVGADRPMGGWHEFIPLSLCNSVGSDLDLTDRYMVNYTLHMNSKKIDAKLRSGQSLVKDGKIILSDSGGYQIITGKEAWIDPEKYGEWAAINVDQAVSLDVPPYTYREKEVMLRSANLQRKNSDLILEAAKGSNLQLFNVLHGLQSEHRDRFHDVVYDDRMTNLCVGGVYYGNVMHVVKNLYALLTEKQFANYKQIHLLGVANPTALLAVIYMSSALRKRGGRNVVVSSDATTPIHSAASRSFLLQSNHTKAIERVDFGRNLDHNYPNAFRRIPCGCPACTALGSVDLLAHEGSSVVRGALLAHNIGVMTNWTRVLLRYAETLEFNDYKEIACQQASRNSSTRRTVTDMLNFAHLLVTEGKKEACRRYEAWLVDGIGTDVSAYDSSLVDFEVEDKSEIEANEKYEARVARYEKVYALFDSYHADKKNFKPPAPPKKNPPAPGKKKNVSSPKNSHNKANKDRLKAKPTKKAEKKKKDKKGVKLDQAA
jgi:queuine/archaeosine tRNA-ribosyltransferase